MLEHEQELNKQKGVRGKVLQQREQYGQRSDGKKAQGHPGEPPGAGVLPERIWERWAVAGLKLPERHPAGWRNLEESEAEK